MNKDNKTIKGEENIGMFTTALAGLVKCFYVAFGMDKEKKELLIKDQDTSTAGKIKFDDINKVINQPDDQPQLSKVREVIRTVSAVAPYLNTVETDTILLILAKALERMEREAEQDDIHNVSE